MLVFLHVDLFCKKIRGEEKIEEVMIILCLFISYQPENFPKILF